MQKTQGIILKRYDYRETSVIATFFTRDYGKIRGVLKGVRQDPSKFASSLEPFSLNEIIFYPSRTSELCLVSHCDCLEPLGVLRSDIRQSGFASTLAETIDLLMPVQDVNQGIFDLLLWSLRQLDKSVDADKIAAIFQLKALHASGFKPHLSACVLCQKGFDYQAYFSTIEGGLLCKHCYTKERKARPIFRGTVASIMHIEKSECDQLLNLGLHPKIRTELKIILSAFVEFHLEKRLRSQTVLDELEQGSLIEPELIS